MGDDLCYRLLRKREIRTASTATPTARAPTCVAAAGESNSTSGASSQSAPGPRERVSHDAVFVSPMCHAGWRRVWAFSRGILLTRGEVLFTAARHAAVPLSVRVVGATIDAKDSSASGGATAHEPTYSSSRAVLQLRQASSTPSLISALRPDGRVGLNGTRRATGFPLNPMPGGRGRMSAEAPRHETAWSTGGPRQLHCRRRKAPSGRRRNSRLSLGQTPLPYAHPTLRARTAAMQLALGPMDAGSVTPAGSPTPG